MSGLLRVPLLVAVASGSAVAALYAFFVRTRLGQRLDQAGLTRVGGPNEASERVAGWLGAISVGVVGAAVLGCVLVALARRNRARALAALALVAGALATTEVLKHVALSRPDYGYGTSESLPSGHTTVVASLALALLVVIPRRLRPPAALLASVAVTLTGAGTVVAGWHRPSDVVAALAVTLCWGAVVLLGLSRWDRSRYAGRFAGRFVGPRPGSHHVTALVGVAIAAVLLLAYGVHPHGGIRDLLVYGTTLGGVAAASAVVVSLFAAMADRYAA